MADALVAEKQAIMWGDASWKARFKQLDTDIFSLDNAVDAELLKRKEQPKPWSQAQKDQWAAIDAWGKDYFTFKFDWSAFKASGGWTGIWATDANVEQVSLFEDRFRQLRSAWDKMTFVVKPATDASRKFTAPPDIPWTAILWVGGGIAVAWGAASAVSAYREYSYRNPSRPESK